MIAVRIDGKTFDGGAGETVLDVARRAGIDIPAFCAEERLSPFDSCGVCVVEVAGEGVVKACSTPIVDGMCVETRSPAAQDVRRAALELLLSNHWGDCIAPCQQECPAHTNCQAYVSLVGNGRFLDGLKILYERLPLPACFGRICPAPCEDACRREVAEEPVQIRHVKRFLGDHGFDYVPPVGPATGRRVAVVGGGPAGLSAAYFLRRRGHAVVVLEAMPRMGGMLRYGIPEYRLPQPVIDRDVEILQRMGIDFRNGVRLGQDVDLEDLRRQYDAIFLGLGAWGTRSLRIPGEEHPAVTQGTHFLRRVNEGERPTLPRRVVVVGGGDTAMDAARCARRLGAEVRILYRRTAEEMPAQEHEVGEVRGEGVEFEYLTQPVAFVVENGSLSGVRCVRVELGEPGEDGRRRPVPVDGSEFLVEAEAVLLAVGQTADTKCLAGTSVAVDEHGKIVVDGETGCTSASDVFAGGDAVTGPDIAVRAVAAAHRAADAIDRFLREDIVVPRSPYVHVKQGVTRGDLGNPARSPRIRTPVRPVEERLNDFREYETGLSDEQAITAGQRCLECGCMVFNDCALRDCATAMEASQDTYEGALPHKRRDERHPFIVRKVGKCIACGRCVRVCREICGVSAIDFTGRGIETEVQVPFNRAWQDSDCVACGACVDVCPTGSLYDRTVLDKQVPLDLEESAPTTCLLCGLTCDVRIRTVDGSYMRTEPADGRSVLCARGRYGWHALKGIPRITEPMLRCGTSHVRVSWDEALGEIAKRLEEARGSLVIFGTGLLTCEEGWLVAQLADRLHAGTPIFDVSACRPSIATDADQMGSWEDLDEARTIIAVGARGPYKKVAMDVRLRSAIRNGARLISVGASVPGASFEVALADLPLLLRALAGGPAFPKLAELASWSSIDGGVFVLEERGVDQAAMERIVEFVSAHPCWKHVRVPATANSIGLRRLGFAEELRAAARAWISVGADPIATAAGRRFELDVETLIAISPIPTKTTERAHVVLPMRLPYETRGHVMGIDGRKTVSIAVDSPLHLETWEVLVRLASALKFDSLPRHYETLVTVAAEAVVDAKGTMVVAGATPASITEIIDERLRSLGIREQ